MSCMADSAPASNLWLIGSLAIAMLLSIRNSTPEDCTADVSIWAALEYIQPHMGTKTLIALPHSASRRLPPSTLSQYELPP